MICYKDKAFCSHSILDCVNTSCPDYFHMNEPIGDLPVKLIDLKHNDCGFAGSNIDKILADREKTHGKYEDVAGTIQYLKYGLHRSRNWNNLSMKQKESLEMIVHKMGRILNGNPNTKDHWEDIAGYATLAANTII